MVNIKKRGLAAAVFVVSSMLIMGCGGKSA